MLHLRANVRVIPEIPGQQRPELSRVQEAADRLSMLGFKVLRLGRFGVSVEAPEAQFLSVLGVHPFDSDGGASPINPNDRKLKDLVDQVEIAPSPQLL
jgi:hypothetical protein